MHAHTMAAALAAAMGVQQVAGGRADWDAVKAQFDVDLAAPPPEETAPVDGARGLKLRALGIT